MSEVKRWRMVHGELIETFPGVKFAMVYETDHEREVAALREENARLIAANKAREEYLTTNGRKQTDMDAYVDLAEAQIDALRARCEAAEGLLRRIVNDRVTHIEGPERWVRLYPEDEDAARRILEGQP